MFFVIRNQCLPKNLKDLRHFETLKLSYQETKAPRSHETKTPRHQKTKKPRNQQTNKPRNPYFLFSSKGTPSPINIPTPTPVENIYEHSLLKRFMINKSCGWIISRLLCVRFEGFAWSLQVCVSVQNKPQT